MSGIKMLPNPPIQKTKRRYTPYILQAIFKSVLTLSRLNQLRGAALAYRHQQ